MSEKIGTIRTRRSIKGYVFLGFFVLVNALLGLASLKALARLVTERSAEAGKNFVTMLIVWLVIAAIVGIPTWLTRGRKQTVVIE